MAIINKSTLLSLLELWFKENEWQLNFRQIIINFKCVLSALTIFILILRMI
jgi:hypothetical protein